MNNAKARSLAYKAWKNNKIKQRRENKAYLLMESSYVAKVIHEYRKDVRKKTGRAPGYFQAALQILVMQKAMQA